MYKWEVFLLSLQRIEWTEFGVAALIFVFFLLFRKLFTKYIFKLIVSLSRRTPSEIFTHVLVSFERPLHMFWIVLGTYLSLVYLPFNIMTIVFVKHMYRSILIMLLGWGLYNYTATRSTIFLRVARRFEIDEDSMLIPFFSKILRTLVIALVVVLVVSEWGYSISGFVAGLGLGGLAFALAAQETIANFFGGVVIITEKPFAKGDWIETPTVEGIVEDIGFRSTNIRTFADALITVPNSVLSNEPITNWSSMNKRRVTFSIGVAYGTPIQKVKTCVRRIEAYLKAHDGVDQEFMIVRFDEFGTSSMDIHVYFFTKTTVWAEWFEVKEEVNFAIMDIIEEEDVTIGVPARHIHVKNPNDIIQEEKNSSS